MSHEVYLRITDLGTNFATAGVIYNREGIALWTGPERPVGFTEAALADARQEAQRQGYAVIDGRPHS